MPTEFPTPSDVVAEFLTVACVAPESSHARTTTARADEILRTHPEAAHASIHTAAARGDADSVRRFLADDASLATATGGPHGWDALTHLCFSHYLRLDRARSDGFVGAATALLDAGASAATGFLARSHRPMPVFESALYGACGIAHHAELTRLLLERGADPNDAEVVYHAGDSYDNAALHRLVETGRLTADSLLTLLLRKCDWHDVEGIRWLLEHGADPTGGTRSPLHHALHRDNDVEIVQLLLDRGARPSAEIDGTNAVALAARVGRGDVLDAMARRGIPLAVQGADALLAACARGHRAAVHTIATSVAGAREGVHAQAATVMSRFAGNGNSTGIRHLLGLGIPVDIRVDAGSDYFDIPPDSTPLHVAAWRARPATVRVLVSHGADVHALDGAGRTPLALAVRACVDSYWTDRRSPESVEILIGAGATPDGIPLPCGYEAVDALLRSIA